MATSAHRSRLRKIAAGMAGLATGLSALAFGPTSASAETDGGGEEKTLTVAFSQEVDSLSPFRAIRVITTSLGRLQYDFLTNYDPDTAETIPALAEEWEPSEDGLTWTYHLRDSKWSDGEQVTADDVAFTFNTMIENEDAAYANGGLVEGFESVTAVDEKTVEIKLSKASASMESLDIPIVPEHIWKDVKDFETFNNDKEFPIVSNGPWIVTGYEVNQSITLEANDEYWRNEERDGPGFDKLVFKVIADADAQVEALKRGEVDFVNGLTPAQYDALSTEPDIAVSAAQAKRFQAVTINPGAEAINGDPVGDGHPALKDPAVREALVRTIDREQIYEGPYGGHGEPNYGLIPTIFDTYHWEPEGDDVKGFDVEEANRLLDEAGYKPGKDGIRVDPKSGKKLSFRFNVHADDPKYVQLAGMWKEWALEAGMELKVEPVAEVGDLLDAGTYDILTTGWTTNPDPQYMLGINLCSGRAATGKDEPSLTDAWYCNEEYDKLYEEQGQILDVEDRAEKVKEMQEILYNDNVFVVLGYGDILEAYRTDTIEEGSFQTQPSKDGVIYGQDGYWSWWSVQPAGMGDESAAGDDGGSNTGVAVGVAAGAVVVLGGGAFFFARRRKAMSEELE